MIRALRLALALWFALLCVSVPAEAMVPPQSAIMSGVSHAPGSIVDLNWGAGKFYVKGAAGPLVDTRASPATCFDTGGNLVQVAANVPCVAGGAINSWEARTNVVPNNTMTGAGVGTWPTGWPSVGTVNGLTTTVVGTGVSQGMTYLRLNVAGTASAGTTQQYSTSANASAPACVQNQVWSNTWYFRNVSGTPPAWAIGIQDFTAGIGFIAGYQAVFTPTANWAPYTFNVLIPDATAARCNPIVYFTYTNTTAYNFTFDVAVPQFELNANATLAAQAFATPPILTSAGAVPRNADSISVATQPCANPSILVSGTPSAPSSSALNQTAAVITDNGVTNILDVFRNAGGAAAGYSVTAGNGYSVTGAAWATGTSAKVSDIVAGTTLSVVVNNGTPVTSAQPNGAASGLTKLYVGVYPGGIQNFNGYISRVALACGASLTSAMLDPPANDNSPRFAALGDILSPPEPRAAAARCFALAA